MTMLDPVITPDDLVVYEGSREDDQDKKQECVFTAEKKETNG